MTVPRPHTRTSSYRPARGEGGAEDLVGPGKSLDSMQDEMGFFLRGLLSKRLILFDLFLKITMAVSDRSQTQNT